jgi:hypothetical protein
MKVRDPMRFQRDIVLLPILKGVSCGASKLNAETGSPAGPTIIVEKLTVKLDAQQLSKNLIIIHTSGRATE